MKKKDKERSAVNPTTAKRNLIIRILIALLWLIGLYFVSNILIGGVVGFFAGMGTDGFSAGKIEGQNATILFFQKYGLYLLVGQLSVFALLAFIGKLPGTTKYKRDRQPKAAATTESNTPRPRLQSGPSAESFYSAKKTLFLVGTAICLSVLIGTGAYFIHSIHQAPITRESKPYRIESEWIMHSILTDIAAMGCYAKYSFDFSLDDIDISFETLPAVNSYAIRATAKLPGINDVYRTILSFESEHHIWSPEVYADFTRNTLKVLGLRLNSTDANQASEADIMRALLSPDMKTLQNENQRISNNLSTDIMRAANHCEAALLTGMFSLREAAGYFSVHPTKAYFVS